MGDWKLTDAQAAKLREYLLRGGFLMLDDFWGTEEWDRFYGKHERVFPTARSWRSTTTTPIFHTVYDLDDRYQMPGQWALARSTDVPQRRHASPRTGAASMTINGRVMVAITFNSDIGDSWEWADDPSYPEKYSALGIRIGVNDVIYAMTH